MGTGALLDNETTTPRVDIMNTFSITRILLVALALVAQSGCIVVEEDDRPRTNRGGGVIETETVTETYTEVEESYVEVDTFGPLRSFQPMMSVVDAVPLDRDRHWDSLWSLYTMSFSDVSDGYACTQNMMEVSHGSVATLNIHGFEVDEEFAACPTGSYTIVPDCDLFEGEACLHTLWRDREGFEVGESYAVGGWVEVVLVPGFGYEPHFCDIQVRTERYPEMDFNTSFAFDSFDLSSQDPYAAPICNI